MFYIELRKRKRYKRQETDGYGRDKRPETETLKRKEITITENYQKNWNRDKKKEKKAIKQSGCPWNQSEDVTNVITERSHIFSDAKKKHS